MTLLRNYPLLWRPKSHDRKQIKAIVLNPMHCNKEEKSKSPVPSYEKPVKHVQEDGMKTLTQSGLFCALHTVWNFIIPFS